MKTALVLAIPAMLLGACTDASEDFLGLYKTTLTLSGAGSQTFTDQLGISDGQTADLILSSQQLGSLTATIIGDTSFAIDQQQITLTDPATGRAFSVTLQGQGTVNDGVLAASGTLSSAGGAYSLMMNGSRQ